MRYHGWTIGVPLTLLQWGVHRHTGVSLDATDVANNFLVANAVYDADRIDAPLWSGARAPTHVAAALSAAYYAAEVHTVGLAGVVLALHLGYRDLKPWIAPLKPFVVALLWTMAVYYAPAWRAAADMAVHTEPLTPAWLFLSIASLSHAADLVDVDDDLADGLHTPAVIMSLEPWEGAGYAIALALAAALLHARSPSAAFSLYDELALGVVAGVVFDSTALLGALVCTTLCVETAAHQFEIVRALLASSEVTHSVAISLLLEGVRLAQALPPPLDALVVDAVFRMASVGDALGSALLHVYHELVRSRLF